MASGSHYPTAIARPLSSPALLLLLRFPLAKTSGSTFGGAPVVASNQFHRRQCRQHSAEITARMTPDKDPGVLRRVIFNCQGKASVAVRRAWGIAIPSREPYSAERDRDFFGVHRPALQYSAGSKTRSAAVVPPWWPRHRQPSIADVTKRHRRGKRVQSLGLRRPRRSPRRRIASSHFQARQGQGRLGRANASHNPQTPAVRHCARLMRPSYSRMPARSK